MRDFGQQRWPPWYGPLGLLAGLGLGIFGGIVVELIAHAGGASLTHVSAGLTDLETLVQDIGFIVVAVYLAARVGPVSESQFGLRWSRSLGRSILAVAGGLLAFYLLSFVWFAALHTSGTEKTLVKEIGGNSGTWGILAACAVTCVVAPLCEEFLFRGFIYSAIRNWRGPWPAALITGLLFGLVHGLSAPAADLLPLAFLGVILCVVYELTGSLYPCILVHLLNNTIAFGSDERWSFRIVELTIASLVAVSAVLWTARRFTPLVESTAPAATPGGE